MYIDQDYSQRGLLRWDPPWARPAGRSGYFPDCSHRGRTAAGWRSCRWTLKAAGSGPPGGHTSLYNTCFYLSFFFFFLTLSLFFFSPLTLTIFPSLKVKKKPVKKWAKPRKKKEANENETFATDSSPSNTVQVKHNQWQLQQEGRREQRPHAGVAACNLISDLRIFL